MQQFSIRTMILVSTHFSIALVVVLSVAQHLGIRALDPGWLGYISLALIFVALVCAVVKPNSNAPWFWMNVSGLVVCANVVYGILSSYYVMNNPPLERYQNALFTSVVSAVCVPSLLAIPIAWVLVTNPKLQPPKMLTFVPLLITVIDTVLLWTLAFLVNRSLWASGG